MGKEHEEIINLLSSTKSNVEGRLSTLQMALNVARSLSRYNDSHYVGDNEYSYQYFQCARCSKDDDPRGITFPTSIPESEIFVALLLYLISLEQLGEIFCKAEDGSDTNGIAKILYKHCCCLNERQIDAIKNLRHSLAHNFGLVSVPISEKYDSFKYTLVFDNYTKDKIVELPKKMWERKAWDDKSEETSTKIYPINLIKLVECVIRRVLLGVTSSETQLNLDIDEIKTKYTILTN